jgi:pyrroloquinoline quinone (PQQ) biosynthesis protein C
LQILADDAQLRTWALGNLNGYWRRWADSARRRGLTATRAPSRRAAAWRVLGAPRLHYTIATGTIASKEAAAQYALEVFEPHWHPLINDALCYWRGAPAARPYRRHPARRHRDAAEFVASVIHAAVR